MFSGLFLCLFATFLNIAIHLNNIAIIATIVMGLGYMFFIYKAVIKDQYKVAAYGSILMTTLIIFPTLWFNNNGITGSIPYYYIFMVFLSAVVLHRLSFKWILLVQLSVISVLALTELHRPQLVVPYTSAQNQFIDLIFTIVAIITVLFLMVQYIMKEYHSSIAELKRVQAELELINQSLQHSSITDELTNLYNRRYMMERLEDLVGHHHEEAALIMIDIDYFKSINDEYGHPVGDQVLKTVGNLLKNELPPSGEIARIGGEEFLIVLTDDAAQNHKHLAQEMRKGVQTIVWDIPQLSITISCGTYRMTEHDTRESALKHVDLALYNSKKSGRNTVSTYKTPYSL
jgi:diguanylate cyclase (GGDEF)-like protein